MGPKQWQRLEIDKKVEVFDKIKDSDWAGNIGFVWGNIEGPMFFKLSNY